MEDGQKDKNDNLDNEAPPRVARTPTPAPVVAPDTNVFRTETVAKTTETTIKKTEPTESKDGSKPGQPSGDTVTKEKAAVPSGKNNQKTGDGKKAESTSGGFKPKVTLPHYLEPTYYIGGGNGVALVEDTMNDLGWKRIREKNDDSYKLKWVELKGAINYHTFKEGDQLVNHIPNCNLLTNKLGLLNSLQDYDRMSMTYKRRAPPLDFLPETFKLDDPRDREAFRNIYKDGDMYICKPTGRNQGKGIFLVRTPEEVQKVFEEQEEKTAEGKPVKPLNRIMQRYLHKPLLLNKKKFDIRAYMLVASTVPFMVLYHKGYVRLSIQDYVVESESLVAHLTNQFIQKKDPTYKDVKEDTTWTMEKLNDYINENVFPEKNIDKDWVLTTLENRIKQIMTYCFNAVKHKLSCKVGYFDLYGLDFMIDEDMKVWLIEVNVNPCLATNCVALKEVVPKVVTETIHIALECFEKSRKGKALMPLQSLNGFQVLVNSCPRSGPAASRKDPSRSKSMSPTGVRRSVTHSPMKEPTIVTMSSDVSKSVGQPPRVTPYGYVNSRGNGVSLRQVKNAPRATPTVVAGTSFSPQQKAANNNGNISNKDSSASKARSDAEKAQNTSPADKKNSAVSGEKSDKEPAPKDTQPATRQSQAATSVKTTVTSQTAQPSRSAGSQPNKSNQNAAKGQTADTGAKPNSSNGKSTNYVRQAVERSKQPARKVTLRKENTAPYKVIVKETQLPAETQIVIVDNKSKTEVATEPRKPARTPKTPTHAQEPAKRHSSMRESSPKVASSLNVPKSQHHQRDSDNQALRNKWNSELKADRNSSPIPKTTATASRTSPQDRTKTPSGSVSGRKSARLTNQKESLNGDGDRTYESKKINVHYTGHGTSPTGITNSGDSITPVDSQPVKYATVFPISPYTEPVAQFKMTHRSKKQMPSESDEKSFRGS